MSSTCLPGDVAGVELRHLRYFVALVDAGTFTHAAARMYIAQPTLSQQIRRLEQHIGTTLVHRGRGGIQLTEAGTVLLEESRTVLSLLDQGVSRTRTAAGLDRPKLRFVMPPDLPQALAVTVASRLRSASVAAGVEVTWLEAPMDAGFGVIRERRADAGVAWLRPGQEEVPDPLDLMLIGSFHPLAWVHVSHPAAARGQLGLAELAGMHVVHGPRQASPVTYDAWLAITRRADPRFTFTDPPLRPLPAALAVVAAGTSQAAVLTGPQCPCGPAAGPPGAGPGLVAGMVPVPVTGRPLTATAGLAWTRDLPRELQQVLFDAADSIAF
jgi:DNA-binding transcriptional LysR family regulator